MTAEEVHGLGLAIDAAGDKQDIALLKNLARKCGHSLDQVSASDRLLLLYFQANAYQEIHHIRSRQDETYLWDWEQDEATAGVLALRRLTSDPAFEEQEPIRRCQAWTNLGNALSNVGRPVEAIEYWNKALSIEPRFAMALGNRGTGLKHYAGAIYDTGHQAVLLAEAHKGLVTAIAKGSLWDSGPQERVEAFFRNSAAHIAEHVDVVGIAAGFNPAAYSLGKTQKEQRYRQWVLDQCLFLNPLNDAASWPVAAHDVFHLPSHSYNIGETPRFVQFYDLLKSEFIAARFFCFEAVTGAGETFPNREVLLFNSFDYAIYELRAEKLKTAFRLAYSLFDKIAVFINDYFHLGRNVGGVGFRNIFYVDTKNGPVVAPSFQGNRNWPLRGLFALSRDLFDPDFKETAEPDAHQLNDLRNAAEHGFLSLHELIPETGSPAKQESIAFDAFEQKTIRMLKLVRAGLIYLSLAIRREEELRSEPDDGSRRVSIPGIPLKRT